MSEARDYGLDPETGEHHVQPDFSGLLRRMRAVTPDAPLDGGIVDMGGEPSSVEDAPEGTFRRVIGNQRILRIRLPDGTLLIDRQRDLYYVISSDDELLKELDEASEDALHVSTERGEELPVKRESSARTRRANCTEEDRPLELSRTFRILGTRALRTAKSGLAGMAEEYGDKAERRYEERQRTEAARKRHDKEPYRARMIRKQIDAYFKLIASGGLNTRGKMPVEVVFRLRQMEEMGFPYYDDYLYDSQDETDV